MVESGRSGSFAAPAHRLPDTSVPLLAGSVGACLRRIAGHFGERHALAWAQDAGIASLTFAQLLAEAERVAAWMLQRGSPGDRVAIWSRNCLEWILAEYGCALSGMVLAAWNPAWTDHECEDAYKLTRPALVLAGHGTRGAPLVERAGRIAGDAIVVPLELLRDMAAQTIPFDLPEPSGEDIFLIQFTSGTTGRAKGAALSHHAAINAAWLRFAAIGADESDVWVNPSPLSHVGGAITILLGAMLTGACYVVMHRFEAGEMLRLIRLAGGTRIGGVPTMLVGLLDHPDWTPGSISLRGIGAGGAQVPQALVERLSQEFGAPVLVAFGQSESPIIASSVPGDSPHLLTQTVGRVSPHVELRITDRLSGRTLTLGEVGRIGVRGPCVMTRYHAMPEATAAAFDADGFLDTGDLGSLGVEGYLRIEGRAREVVIRGGENIYPAEVEGAILSHPDVVAVAVVGVADDRWGHQVAAAVVPRPGVAGLTAEMLESHAAIRLAHFKVPRRWLFVDSLPMTASGKVRKVVIEGWFAV